MTMTARSFGAFDNTFATLSTYWRSTMSTLVSESVRMCSSSLSTYRKLTLTITALALKIATIDSTASIPFLLYRPTDSPGPTPSARRVCASPLARCSSSV